MNDRIAVIANACAGSGCDAGWGREVVDRFRAAGREAEVLLADESTSVGDLIARVLASDVETVVAAGGDGTINSVASALVGTTRRLGVLPAGTLNHFARDLGIPFDLAGAVDVIIGGHVAPIDIGAVNDRYFVNNSSIGIYPSIVRHREKQRRLGWSKWAALAWASLAVLRRHPFMDVELYANGSARRLRAPFVFVGNNVYRMDGFNIGARDAVDRGELSLYMTGRSTRRGLVALALHALLGRLHQAQDFAADTATEIVIATRHRYANVSTDGEIAVLSTPLRYRILPGALRVFVPAPAPPPTTDA